MKDVQSAERDLNITIGFGGKVILWRAMLTITETHLGFVKPVMMNYQKKSCTKSHKMDGGIDNA